MRIRQLRQRKTLVIRAAMLAAFGCVTCRAGVADYSTNYPACQTSVCAPGSLVWSAGEFDQIYLVQGSASNTAQTQRLSPDLLAQTLQTLTVVGANGREPIFNAESATKFAQGLSIALSKAGPGKDALFLITNAKGFHGLLSSPFGNSGRAFVDANGLNLIFAEVGVDFVGPYHAVGKVRTFDFGSRSKASSVSVSLGNGAQPRPDWVVISLSGQTNQAETHQPISTRILPVEPPPPLPTMTRDAAYYSALEARLEGLKRLREKNLITEQEYQDKRQEILKEL